MISIHDFEMVLRSHGFTVHRTFEQEDTIYFEDQSLFGFVAQHPSARSIDENWWHQQEAFVRRFTPRLERQPLKAWNLYAVYFTNESPDHVGTNALVKIEEDFRSARKIARVGVVTRTDIEQVLLPLLPIRSVDTNALVDTSTGIRSKLSSDEKLMYDFLSEARQTEPDVPNWLFSV